MFRAEFESCCPIKKFRVQVMSKKKPWITKGLENACKKKNNLYRNFLKCKSTSSLCRYKAYKNKLTTALRYAEKEYYNRLLYEKKDDIKGTWKIINSMIKGNKSNVSYPEEFYDKGQCIKNGKTIADGFNKFFTNVGPTLAANIKTPVTAQSIFETMGMKNVKSMFVNPVTQVELFKILNTCKAKHSCDVDDISMYIVKNTFKAIVTPLLHICNLSFSTGVFPDGTVDSV